MPKYTFTFTVREEWTAEFTADNPEQAEQLFQQVINDEINGNELPDYERNRGLYTEFDENSLDEDDPALTTCPDAATTCDGTCEHNFCEARTICEDAACDGECKNYYCSEREE